MGRVKKNSGVSDGRFFTKKKKEEKKTWAQNTGFCIINTLRHTYFFTIFGWGDPFQLRSWSEGWLKLKSSLEKPSDKCQKTHIIQNSFHDA